MRGAQPLAIGHNLYLTKVKNMISEVKSLIQKKVDKQTIETLKDLLSKAESGDLTSVIFIDKYIDGKIGHGWSGRPCINMIGEAEHIKYKFFTQMYFPLEDDV